MIRMLAISAMMICVRTAVATEDPIPAYEYVYVDDYFTQTPGDPCIGGELCLHWFSSRRLQTEGLQGQDWNAMPRPNGGNE